jgi:hypothetical protein
LKKKILLLPIIIILATLSSCSVAEKIYDSALDVVLSGTIPETVEHEGVTYRYGFYDEYLHLTNDYWNKTSLSDEELGVFREGGHRFMRESYGNGFDFLLSDAGDKWAGILYCSEIQWEEAKAFYDDHNNYTYYCDEKREPTIECEIDGDKFNELLTFIYTHSYKPFGSNDHVEIVPFAYEEWGNTKEYVFYKKSKDNIFTSSTGTGSSLRIIDGQLYKVFDYIGDGDINKFEGDTMNGVAIPNDLSTYFIEFLRDQGFEE